MSRRLLLAAFALTAALIAPAPARAQGYVPGATCAAGNAVTAQTLAAGTVCGAVTVPLGQSHLPFVLVSSGTMGNNGALSGVTAVATAYPNAYVHLPAGAIATGSTAGWYYAVFSSTTAATVYNNTYSTSTCGTPAIPGSPTAFSTTGPGSFTQTTASHITAYCLAIAGNTIGANGEVRASLAITNNNSGNSKQIQLTFGGSYTAGTNSQTSNVSSGYIGGFANRGVANVQVPIAASSMFVSSNGTAASFGAIDTTASQTLAVTLDLVTTATDTMTLETAEVELLRGVP